MGVKTAVSVAVAGVAAGLVARRLLREKQDTADDSRHPEGWKAVTILADGAPFESGDYPEPLKGLADVIEIRTSRAPADKGFEVHARVRGDVDATDVFGDEDPEQSLRAALRDTKQLVETGEILRGTPRPHGHRPVTLFGAAVDKAEAEAKGGGVL